MSPKLQKFPGKMVKLRRVSDGGGKEFKAVLITTYSPSDRPDADSVGNHAPLAPLFDKLEDSKAYFKDRMLNINAGLSNTELKFAFFDSLETMARRVSGGRENLIAVLRILEIDVVEHFSHPWKHIILDIINYLLYRLDCNNAKADMGSGTAKISGMLEDYGFINDRKLSDFFTEIRHGRPLSLHIRGDDPEVRALAYCTGPLRLSMVESVSKYRLYLGKDGCYRFAIYLSELRDIFQSLKQTFNLQDLENYNLDYQPEDDHIFVILGELIQQYAHDLDAENQDHLQSSLYLVLHHMFGVLEGDLEKILVSKLRFVTETGPTFTLSFTFTVFDKSQKVHCEVGKTIELPIYFLDGFQKYLDILKRNHSESFFTSSLLNNSTQHFDVNQTRSSGLHAKLRRRLFNLEGDKRQVYNQLLFANMRPYKVKKHQTVTLRDYVSWLRDFQVLGERQVYLWFLIVFTGLY